MRAERLAWAGLPDRPGPGSMGPRGALPLGHGIESRCRLALMQLRPLFTEQRIEIPTRPSWSPCRCITPGGYG